MEINEAEFGDGGEELHRSKRKIGLYLWLCVAVSKRPGSPLNGWMLVSQTQVIQRLYCYGQETDTKKRDSEGTHSPRPL